MMCLKPKEAITVVGTMFGIFHFYAFAIWLTLLKVEVFNDEKDKTLRYQRFLLKGTPMEEG